jgi:hypothetical protein
VGASPSRLWRCPADRADRVTRMRYQELCFSAFVLSAAIASNNCSHSRNLPLGHAGSTPKPLCLNQTDPPPSVDGLFHYPGSPSAAVAPGARKPPVRAWASSGGRQRREIPKARRFSRRRFFSAVSQPNRFAKVRDLGVTVYRRPIHVRLQLTCGRDASR